ncbi:MAG: NmrA family NAD(P)-binding protein [Alphaproteobacteria bacterium]|nr:NmrA family NAD(P)-binding protein [Alphaproteobacteria bacterium]
MSDKKIIAVAGATGAQGGGLVRAIQADKDGPFRARAITRNPDSDAAKALAAIGAEVVQGDLSDQASIDRAFEGVHGAYCVTFFWAHMSPEREMEEARTLAVAAQRGGVQHVVWSTLEDTRKWVPLESDQMPTLLKRYKVPHFDVKGEADKFFVTLPTTYLLTSFYWDNLVSFGMNPKPDGQGGYTFTLPMDEAKLPGIAAEDIGKCAYGVFKEGASAIGKHIGISGEHVSGAEMAAILSDVLGISVRHHAASPEEFRNYGFPGADDLGNMFQFKRDFEAAFRGARDVETARKLNPELLNFRQFVDLHKAEIPLT